MSSAQQAARITDPVTHGLGMVGLAGGVLLGAAAGAVLLAALPATAGALAIGMAGVAAVGGTAFGGLTGNQLITGIQRASGLASPPTGLIGMVGSPNVRIGMLRAARAQADMVAACHGLFGSCHYPIPPVPPAPIAEGASTIRINGLLAARVGSRTVCGARVQKGYAAVYYGGPTTQLLAVMDFEAMVLTGLGFVALASLIAAVPLTLAAGTTVFVTSAAVFGASFALNDGLGKLGDRFGVGWRDILQGAFGLLTVVGGLAKARAEAGRDSASSEIPFGDPPVAKLTPIERGQLRAARFGPGWPSASLTGTVQRIAGDNPMVTKQGSKTIYRNRINGKQVVYDRGGNYFRVEDPSIRSSRRFCDPDGNRIPPNKREVGPGGHPRETGKSYEEYQQDTHFKNSDLEDN